MDVCDRCKQEVRYGRRGAMLGYLHREETDHNVRFGPPGPTPAEAEATRIAYLQATDQWTAPTEEDDDPEPIPDPEIRAMRLDPDVKRLFIASPDGLIEATFPGGAKTLVNAARKTGWEMAASYCRGPWLHASSWEPTGVVDHVVLRLRRGRERAVATWRRHNDGSMKLESSWYWTDDIAGSLEQINSSDLRERIKVPCTPTAPEQDLTPIPVARPA